jgi:hypothetical protein
MEAVSIRQERKVSFVSFNNSSPIGENITSGKQAASECNTVSLEFFISELRRRVDNHFAAKNDEAS